MRNYVYSSFFHNDVKRNVLKLNPVFSKSRQTPFFSFGIWHSLMHINVSLRDYVLSMKSYKMHRNCRVCCRHQKYVMVQNVSLEVRLRFYRYFVYFDSILRVKVTNDNPCDAYRCFCIRVLNAKL